MDALHALADSSTLGYAMSNEATTGRSSRLPEPGPSFRLLRPPRDLPDRGDSGPCGGSAQASACDVAQHAQRKAAVNDKNDPPTGSLSRRRLRGIRDAEAFAQELADAGAHETPRARSRFPTIRRGRSEYSPCRPRVSRTALELARRRIAGEYRFIELLKEGRSLLPDLVEAEADPNSVLFHTEARLRTATKLIDRGENLALPPSSQPMTQSSSSSTPLSGRTPKSRRGEKAEAAFRSPASGKSPLWRGSRYASRGVIQNTPPRSRGDAAPDNPLLLVLEEGWILSDVPNPTRLPDADARPVSTERNVVIYPSS